MNKEIFYKLYNLDTKELYDEIYRDEFLAEKECDRKIFYGHNVVIKKFSLVELEAKPFYVYKIFDKLSNCYSPINRVFTDFNTAKTVAEWNEDLEIHEFELVFKGIKDGK